MESQRSANHMGDGFLSRRVLVEAMASCVAYDPGQDETSDPDDFPPDEEPEEEKEPQPAGDKNKKKRKGDPG